METKQLFDSHHETYTKINTLYKRDSNNKNRIIIGDFAMPEFEYLYNNLWVCEEKIDGTNVFAWWDGHTVEFHGKTENANVPTHLLHKMAEIFTEEKLSEIFPLKYDENENEIPFEVKIYGEGYGVKIQKGGNYISNDCDVILFDVKVGNWWLNRDSVEDIAVKLGISICPIIATTTLKEAEKLVKKGFKSTIAENKEYDAAGLVCKPLVQLFDRAGRRIICKIKTVDYRDLN